MSEIAAGLHIPEAVAHAASEERLGRLQAVHVAMRTGSFRLLTGIVALMIGVAISAAYLVSYSSIFSWLPWWQSIIIPLIGTAWIIVGCWTIFVPFLLPRSTVYVYPEGLLYVTRKIEIIPWQAMERIWKVNRHVTNKPDQATYVIRRSDEQLFEFGPQFSESKLLGSLLEREITQRLLPRALAVYTRGETVLFEEIALNTEGITLRTGRRKLLWSELERLSVTAKQLEWYKRDDPQPWAVHPLGMIPNIEVLRGLVSYAQHALLRETSPKIVAYQAGATVDFGALHVNKQGVSLDGSADFVPWSEIAGIGVSDREIIIGRKDTGQWYTFPDWMIRDAAILKDLVEYVLQKKRV